MRGIFLAIEDMSLNNITCAHLQKTSSSFSDGLVRQVATCGTHYINIFADVNHKEMNTT